MPQARRDVMVALPDGVCVFCAYTILRLRWVCVGVPSRVFLFLVFMVARGNSRE